MTHSLGRKNCVNKGALWDGSSHFGWESRYEWQVVASQKLCNVKKSKEMFDSVISRKQRFIKVKHFELSGIKVILMHDFLNALGTFP